MRLLRLVELFLVFGDVFHVALVFILNFVQLRRLSLSESVKFIFAFKIWRICTSRRAWQGLHRASLSYLRLLDTKRRRLLQPLVLQHLFGIYQLGVLIEITWFVTTINLLWSRILRFQPLFHFKLGLERLFAFWADFIFNILLAQLLRLAFVALNSVWKSWRLVVMRQLAKAHTIRVSEVRLHCEHLRRKHLNRPPQLTKGLCVTQSIIIFGRLRLILG